MKEYSNNEWRDKYKTYQRNFTTRVDNFVAKHGTIYTPPMYTFEQFKIVYKTSYELADASDRRGLIPKLVTKQFGQWKFDDKVAKHIIEWQNKNWTKEIKKALGVSSKEQAIQQGLIARNQTEIIYRSKGGNNSWLLFDAAIKARYEELKDLGYSTRAISNMITLEFYDGSY